MRRTEPEEHGYLVGFTIRERNFAVLQEYEDVLVRSRRLLWRPLFLTFDGDLYIFFDYCSGLDLLLYVFFGTYF